MERHEVNHGKVRRNDWKWKSEIDDLLTYYRNKFCECGCGNKLHPTRKQIRDSRSKGKPLRVLKGHHNKLKEAKKWILSGKNHPFYGKHHTQKSLAIMSMKTMKEKHPCWKGGITKPFPFRRGWKKIREKVLKRDNFTCQICKKVKDRSLLHIHHIKSRRIFLEAKEAHNLSNLTTFCRSCHLTHENRLKAQRK